MEESKTDPDFYYHSTVPIIKRIIYLKKDPKRHCQILFDAVQQKCFCGSTVHIFHGKVASGN